MAATIWENIDKQSFLFKKSMENMMIMPWSCYESWRPCQETWRPCRHHGMIMTMFRHDHGMIRARSWHGSHVFPTLDILEKILTKARSGVHVCGLKQGYQFFSTLKHFGRRVSSEILLSRGNKQHFCLIFDQMLLNLIISRREPLKFLSYQKQAKNSQSRRHS